MKKKLRTALAAVLTLTLVIGLAGTVRQLMDYRKGAQGYSDAAETANVALPTAPPEDETETPPPATDPEPAATEPEPAADPYAEALAETDLTALREVNGDVLGWFAIPDTEISYPLMQGEDNDHYLKHTWQNERNSVGSIFVDFRSSPDLLDLNTVIYGHQMKNGSMFARLHRYKNDGYWEEHPSVYIALEDGVYIYDVFAWYETGTVDTYVVSFSDDEEKQAYIDGCLEQAYVDTGIVPSVDDHIITLSTCTGTGHATRWVVQAVLRDSLAPEG